AVAETSLERVRALGEGVPLGPSALGLDFVRLLSGQRRIYLPYAPEYAVAQLTQAAVQQIAAPKKRQERGASSSQPAAHLPYALICSAVCQAGIDCLNRIVTPSGRHIDLGQVQV